MDIGYYLSTRDAKGWYPNLLRCYPKYILKNHNTPLKALITVLITCTTFFSASFSLEASWFIDLNRFHISVHGLTECLDCHEERVDQTLHPDPLDVSKKLKDIVG